MRSLTAFFLLLSVGLFAPLRLAWVRVHPC